MEPNMSVVYQTIFCLTQQCLWTASTKSIKTISFFGVAMIHPEMKHFQNPTTYIRIIPWVSSKLKVVIKLLARRILEYVPRSRKNVRSTHHLFCSSYRLIPFNILTVFFGWENIMKACDNPTQRWINDKWTQRNPPKICHVSKSKTPLHFTLCLHIRQPPGNIWAGFPSGQTPGPHKFAFKQMTTYSCIRKNIRFLGHRIFRLKKDIIFKWYPRWSNGIFDCGISTITWLQKRVVFVFRDSKGTIDVISYHPNTQCTWMHGVFTYIYPTPSLTVNLPVCLNHQYSCKKWNPSRIKRPLRFWISGGLAKMALWEESTCPIFPQSSLKCAACHEDKHWHHNRHKI